MTPRDGLTGASFARRRRATVDSRSALTLRKIAIFVVPGRGISKIRQRFFQSNSRFSISRYPQTYPAQKSRAEVALFLVINVELNRKRPPAVRAFCLKPRSPLAGLTKARIRKGLCNFFAVTFRHTRSARGGVPGAANLRFHRIDDICSLCVVE